MVRFTLRSRLWWVVVAAAFLLGPLVVFGFPADAELKERALVIGISLIGVGLIFTKYAMVSAIRLDENGIVVERRLMPNLVFAWRGTVIKHHPGRSRAAAGLMIESSGAEGEYREPYFFPLREVDDSERLLTELRERLGPRFREEGE